MGMSIRHSPDSVPSPRILAFDKRAKTISAAVTAFDCSEDIVLVEKAKAEIRGEGTESGECLIDINGRRHDNDGTCANAAWDRYGEEEYCKVKHLDYLDLKHDKYKWLTPMFEYYWQNGIDKKGMAFLEAADF